MPEKVYCENCLYLRPPHRPRAYSDASARDPKVLERWAKWDQQRQEIEQSERDRFRLKLPFTWKPQSYSWCEWWTDRGYHQWERDQFGKPVIVYELTARHNKNHDCRYWYGNEQALMPESARIFVRDLDGRIVLWTQGAERLYGFSKVEALGRVSQQLLRTEFPEPAARIEQKLYGSGKWEGELIHRRRDGERLVVASRWTLHRDPMGQPLSILVASTGKSHSGAK